MDINILKNFLVVAQEESLTKAGEILHISQPTLSKQIQSLEEECGNKLFDRSNKMMNLNAQGRIFWQRAREIVDLYQKTLAEVNPKPGVVAGEIRMAVSESSVLREVFKLAREYNQKYPLTIFRVLNGDNFTVKDRVESGDVDMGLVFNNVDEKQFDSIMINTNECIDVLMPADHPLASRGSLSIKDVERYPLIVHDELFRDRPKINLKRCVATFTMLYTAELMVEAGLGIALVNDSTLNFESNGLMIKKMTDINSLSVSIVWKKGGLLSQQAELFLETLRNELGK